MTVKEYALDVNKTVDEILKKCLDLDIRVNDEEDLLEEDDIILLDNATYDEEEALEDLAEDLAEDFVKKEKINIISSAKIALQCMICRCFLLILVHNKTCRGNLC